MPEQEVIFAHELLLFHDTQHPYTASITPVDIDRATRQVESHSLKRPPTVYPVNWVTHKTAFQTALKRWRAQADDNAEPPATAREVGRSSPNRLENTLLPGAFPGGQLESPTQTPRKERPAQTPRKERRARSLQDQRAFPKQHQQHQRSFQDQHQVTPESNTSAGPSYRNPDQPHHSIEKEDIMPATRASGSAGSHPTEETSPPRPATTDPLVREFIQMFRDMRQDQLEILRDRPQYTPGPQGASLRPADIGFFDPGLKDPQGLGVVSDSKANTYTDVFAFTQRLQHLKETHGEDVVKMTWTTCLKGRALHWHSQLCTDLERQLLATAELTHVCKTLENRFKEPLSEVWTRLRAARYTIRDEANGKDINAFVHTHLRDTKTTGQDVQSQLQALHEAFDATIQGIVPPPSETTTVEGFLENVRQRQSTIAAMAREKFGQRNPGRPPFAARYPNTNSPRPYQLGPYNRQPIYRPAQQWNRPWGRPPPYGNQRGDYQRQQGDYQRQPPQPANQYGTQRGAQFDRANRYGGQQRTGGYNAYNPGTARQPYQPYRNQNQYPYEQQRTLPALPAPPKAYYTQYENHDEPQEDGYYDQQENTAWNGGEEAEAYHHFGQEGDNEDGSGEGWTQPPPVEGATEDAQWVGVAMPIFSCRMCNESFGSRNGLFAHLQAAHGIERESKFAAEQPVVQSEIHDTIHHYQPQSNRDHENRAFFIASRAEAAVVDTGECRDAVELVAAPPEAKTHQVPVIQSQVPTQRDAGLGQAFRSWTYLRFWLCPNPHRPQDQCDVCADTGCSISLVDGTWLAKIYPETELRTRAKPVEVRGIGSAKHTTD